MPKRYMGTAYDKDMGTFNADAQQQPKTTGVHAVIAAAPGTDDEDDSKGAWAVLPQGLQAGSAAAVLSGPKHFPPLPEDIDDHEDDEGTAVQIVNAITDAKPQPRPKMPRMPKSAKKKSKPVPPSRERLIQVANLIQEGKLKSPPVAKDEVLVLHDSGAAPNIANHAKHFPGSTLVPSKDGDKFSTATGEPFGSNGEMSVNFESLEGHQKTFTFKNADVAIPILSIGLLTDDDHEATFRKNDGVLKRVPTNQTIKLVRVYGVYFFSF